MGWISYSNKWRAECNQFFDVESASCEHTPRRFNLDVLYTTEHCRSFNGLSGISDATMYSTLMSIECLKISHGKLNERTRIGSRKLKCTVIFLANLQTGWGGGEGVV